METKTSVLIADANEDYRTLMSDVIAQEGDLTVCAAVGDGLEVLELTSKLRPDVILLDLVLPKLDGMEVLRRLRQTSQIPVIMLTSKDEEIDEILGFNLGADDYIHKPFSQRLLIERVKALLRRTGADGVEPEPSAEASGKAIKRGKLTMDPARHESMWDGRPVKLTVTEFLLLQALAQRPGFVKSRDNLMDAAYDDQVYVDDRTIDSHVKRMRKKFRAVDPEFDAIETLYGVGYRYRES